MSAIFNNWDKITAKYLVPYMKKHSGEHGYHMCPNCLQDVIYYRKWDKDGATFEEVYKPCLYGGRSIYVISKLSFGMAFYCHYCDEHYYLIYNEPKEKYEYIKQKELKSNDVLLIAKTHSKNKIWVMRTVTDYMHEKYARECRKRYEDNSSK